VSKPSKKSKPKQSKPASSSTLPSTVVISTRASAELRDKLVETQKRLGHRNVAETVLKALAEYIERKRAR